MTNIERDFAPVVEGRTCYTCGVKEGKKHACWCSLTWESKMAKLARTVDLRSLTGGPECLTEVTVLTSSGASHCLAVLSGCSLSANSVNVWSLDAKLKSGVDFEHDLVPAFSIKLVGLAFSYMCVGVTVFEAYLAPGDPDSFCVPGPSDIIPVSSRVCSCPLAHRVVKEGVGPNRELYALVKDLRFQVVVTYPEHVIESLGEENCSACPRCKEKDRDPDGSGIVSHVGAGYVNPCGYCSHPKVESDICLMCGELVLTKSEGK